MNQIVGSLGSPIHLELHVQTKMVNLVTYLANQITHQSHLTNGIVLVCPSNNILFIVFALPSILLTSPLVSKLQIITLLALTNSRLQNIVSDTCCPPLASKFKILLVYNSITVLHQLTSTVYHLQHNNTTKMKIIHVILHGFIKLDGNEISNQGHQRSIVAMLRMSYFFIFILHYASDL